MKWFENVFLPSLEERYNQRNGKMWLTEKQADVCQKTRGLLFSFCICLYFTIFFLKTVGKIFFLCYNIICLSMLCHAMKQEIKQGLFTPTDIQRK